jgi:hypothetical protein
MPIDWSDVDDAIKDAAKKTDDELAAKVSSLTRFTDEEIKKLFPKPADVARLSELMQIVQASTSEQEKVNRLAKNIQSLGGTVLTLLKALK